MAKFTANSINLIPALLQSRAPGDDVPFAQERSAL